MGRRHALGRSVTERAHEGAAVAQAEFRRQGYGLAPLQSAVDGRGDGGSSGSSSGGGGSGGGGSGPEPLLDAEPRDWSWVFGALYEAARVPGQPHGHAPHHSSNLGSMQLNLPDTVLFEGGKPVKWMGTSETDGRVERRLLDGGPGDDYEDDFESMTIGGGGSGGGGGGSTMSGRTGRRGHSAAGSNPLAGNAAPHVLRQMRRIVKGFEACAKRLKRTLARDNLPSSLASSSSSVLSAGSDLGGGGFGANSGTNSGTSSGHGGGAAPVPGLGRFGEPDGPFAVAW